MMEIKKKEMKGQSREAGQDHYLGVLIKTISEQMRRRGDAVMKKLGLTFMQSVVLQILLSSGGEVPQKTIEEALQVTHPTVVGIIGRLERKGFVSTKQDQKDRRRKIVQATDETARLWEVAKECRDDGEAAMTKGMTEEETGELRRLLGIVLRNLEEREREKGTCGKY